MVVNRATDVAGDDTAALVGYLRERDVACPLCRYNLRGLQSPRCPECGRELRLGVSMAEPYLPAWVATLVAVLPPAGIGLVIGSWFAYAVTRDGPRAVSDLTDLPASLAFVLVHMVACVPGSVLLVAFRRRFLRLPRRVQFAAAAGCWAAVGVSLLCVTSWVR